MNEYNENILSDTDQKSLSKRPVTQYSKDFNHELLVLLVEAQNMFLIEAQKLLIVKIQ